MLLKLETIDEAGCPELHPLLPLDVEEGETHHRITQPTRSITNPVSRSRRPAWRRNSVARRSQSRSPGPPFLTSSWSPSGKKAQEYRTLRGKARIIAMIQAFCFDIIETGSIKGISLDACPGIRTPDEGYPYETAHVQGVGRGQGHFAFVGFPVSRIVDVTVLPDVVFDVLEPPEHDHAENLLRKRACLISREFTQDFKLPSFEVKFFLFECKLLYQLL